MATGITGYSHGYIADQTQLLQTVVDGLAVYNQTVDPVIAEFSQEVVSEVLRVPQAPIQFDRGADGASPLAQRQSYRLIQTPFEDFIAGSPFTVQGLQDALPTDIQNTLDGLMLGDAERQDMEFFRCLFTSRTAGSVGTAYRASFYNGETDVPAFKNNTFSGAHNHYVGMNTTTLALSQLDTAINHIRHHGYGTRPGSLVAYFHTDQEDDLKALLNISVASSLTTPMRIAAQDQGLREQELTYAGCILRTNDNVPSGYFGVFARDVRPIAKRVHRDPMWRGLQRYSKTFTENFPLAGNEFMNRYGFVVQHLGAGYCAQLVASTSYTNPTFRLT